MALDAQDTSRGQGREADGGGRAQPHIRLKSGRRGAMHLLYSGGTGDRASLRVCVWCGVSTAQPASVSARTQHSNGAVDSAILLPMVSVTRGQMRGSKNMRWKVLEISNSCFTSDAALRGWNLRLSSCVLSGSSDWPSGMAVPVAK